MKTNLIKGQVTQALTRVNAAYVTREGAGARLNKNGENADIATARKLFASFTDAQWEAVYNVCGTAWVSGLGKTKLKTAKRLPLVLSFIATGDVTDLKASARAFVLGLSALAVAGLVNKNGARFALTGRGDENTSDEVKAVDTARKLQRVLGLVGVGSFSTQWSVAFSDGNLGSVLGCGSHPKGSRDLPTVNLDSPVTVALLDRVSNLTDGQIDQLRDMIESGKRS